ncbi:hypothetical protein ACFTZI_32540 [Streptomyces decoyicus]|uniref:hypothetical protein n=1 Tax=Streptomyces decoyicus TaxID=249567 RepID=UPI003643FCAB
MSIPTAVEWFTSQRTAAVATAVSVLCIAVAVAAVRIWQLTGPSIGGAVAPTPGGQTKARRKLSAGTLAAVAAFIICTSVSLNTSYRFTGDADGLAMTSTVERLLSCAAYESLMAMCVLGARERMAESKSPGWYGGAVWIFAALSAIPAAIEGDGLTAATAVRVIVGSFGSALAAHSALGLDLKHRTGSDSETPAAMLLRDLRARLMSRLGLGERTRTAQQIAQERALSHAVELQDEYMRLPEKGKRKGRRIARRLAAAQDAAGIATDEGQRALFVARVTLRAHATSLVIDPDRSPWTEQAASLNAEYAERIERIEALADEEEAAVLQASAQGYRTAAAGGPVGKRVTVSLPPLEDDEHDQEEPEQGDEEPARDVLDLSSYVTKKDKLIALYEAMIRPDDPRSTNAIAEQLLGELARRGVNYDRGPANRTVGELRGDTQDAADEPERERCSA